METANHQRQQAKIIADLNKPLIQQVCPTCEFLSTKYSAIRNCAVLDEAAFIAWRKCQGKYWSPIPPHVPILIRFKRWLIG